MMNIKHRLKKLERKANLSDGFCVCFPNYFESALDWIYDGLPFVEVQLPEGDFCPKCQKPVNQMNRQMLSQLIEIYGY